MLDNTEVECLRTNQPQTIHGFNEADELGVDIGGGEGDLGNNDAINIPMVGTIKSLNVSVATGIVLFETVKQRL